MAIFKYCSTNSKFWPSFHHWSSTFQTKHPILNLHNFHVNAIYIYIGDPTIILLNPTSIIGFCLLKPLTNQISVPHDMVKNVRSMQNWVVEVAPSTFVSRRRSSSSPKLATIVEEGSNNIEILPDRVFFFLPVLVSFVSYFLLYRHIFDV